MIILIRMISHQRKCKKYYPTHKRTPATIIYAYHSKFAVYKHAFIQGGMSRVHCCAFTARP